MDAGEMKTCHCVWQLFSLTSGPLMSLVGDTDGRTDMGTALQPPGEETVSHDGSAPNVLSVNLGFFGIAGV